jgi:hypothetical protein
MVRLYSLIEVLQWCHSAGTVVLQWCYSGCYSGCYSCVRLTIAASSSVISNPPCVLKRCQSDFSVVLQCVLQWC